MGTSDKWEAFLKNGSVLAYLSYVADKKSNPLECGKKHETTNARVNNKGNEHWRER